MFFWMNPSNSSNCSRGIESLALFSSTGAGELGTSRELGAFEEVSEIGGVGITADRVYSSIGKGMVVLVTLFLRCASRRMNRFPHLGQGNFLAFPLDVLSRVL